MTSTGPGTPQGETPADVHEIPEAEKIAAQWEARHDLAARGRSPDPMRVQHYLAHLRSEESLQQARQPRDAARVPVAAGAPSGGHGTRDGGAHGPAVDHGGWRVWFRHTVHKDAAHQAAAHEDAAHQDAASS